MSNLSEKVRSGQIVSPSPKGSTGPRNTAQIPGVLKVKTLAITNAIISWVDADHEEQIIKDIKEMELCPDAKVSPDKRLYKYQTSRRAAAG